MDKLERHVRRELSRFGADHMGMDGDMVEIVRAWPAAVGETVSRNAWPARLARDGTLHVNTSSSTWAFELGRLAETISGQLRAELGEATPAALRFVPGPIPEPQATPESLVPPALEIAPAHRAEAAELAAVIEDEELRQLVSRAAAASLSRARSDRHF